MNPQTSKIDRLTVFTFLWACQALVHQEFYLLWLPNHNLLGWAVTISGVATLLFPRSLSLLSILALSSIVYNVEKWPFVVNHVLMETLVNIVILCAISATYFRHRNSDNAEKREAIVDRFGPVLATSLVVMYYFAFIAKLNYDFFNLEVSCVTQMYGDLLNRVPFLPDTPWAHWFSIWATVIIEALIPICFTFRRTRWLGLAIGMPFHFMLGMIGHRTFSGLAYALYGLFLLTPLSDWLNATAETIRSRVESRQWQRILTAVRSVVVIGVSVLIASRLTGNYEAGIGPLKFFRVPWAIWIVWSWILMGVFAIAFWRSVPQNERIPVAGPGALWIFVGIVFLNGSSQYLGLKTQTSFTMYSNLRTEGGVNNHLFMPAARLTSFQDELVEVVEFDAPEIDEAEYPAMKKVVSVLKNSTTQNQYVSRFELQRAVVMAEEMALPVKVNYLDQGVHKRYDSDANDANGNELFVKQPIWWRKLLYFRPVDKSGPMCCRH